MLGLCWACKGFSVAVAKVATLHCGAWLLVVVASLVAELGDLGCTGFSSCSVCAQWLWPQGSRVLAQ